MKLYHLSKEKISEMTPRVPVSKYEEQETPRICFATTIQGCLIGINENKDITGDVYNVYSIETNDFYKPKKSEVPDSNITGEVWYLHKCKPKYEYSIKIVGKRYSEIKKINGHDFEIPNWKYEIIKESL